MTSHCAHAIVSPPLARPRDALCCLRVWLPLVISHAGTFPAWAALPKTEVIKVAMPWKESLATNPPNPYRVSLGGVV
jgi:hypothetical protein